MTSHTTPAGPAGGPGAGTGQRRRLIRELLLVAGLFAVYKGGRLLSTDRTDEAFRNAGRIWDAERALHLPGEGAVQRLLLPGGAPGGGGAVAGGTGEVLVHAANTYYAAVHFPATALFLVWLYLRRPAHYLWTRRVLTALTGAALALHLAFPLAPPRMLAAARLVDTAQVYGPAVYRSAPEADTLANQFAAMPSLHFGWALMVALGLIAATRSRWRLLWLLHPLLTLVVIVGTANHYWLDAVVATALLGAALLLIRRPKPPARSLAVVRHLPQRWRTADHEPAGAGPEGAQSSGTGTADAGPGAVRGAGAAGAAGARSRAVAPRAAAGTAAGVGR
ncbi:phosphatase PAP2 family protein [Streptomyces sp. NPDC046866]|uniref:phosphatase PAP2 family protein n=1 Tax=Streptomyces sp. NPDC046866 TaxID=3154921 RepID=UPI003452E271